jgi:hypothetical protein
MAENSPHHYEKNYFEKFQSFYFYKPSKFNEKSVTIPLYMVIIDKVSR